VHHRCRWQICQISAGVIDTGGNGVIDTGGKFATGVVDTLTCEYLCKLSKKFKKIPKFFSWAWGKAIHGKNTK
jgi:hypothetical protein